METTEEGFEPSRDKNLIALAGQRNTGLCDSVKWVRQESNLRTPVRTDFESVAVDRLATYPSEELTVLYFVCSNVVTVILFQNDLLIP